MNWGQFKDPLCYLCLIGPVVAPWSLTPDVAGSNNPFNLIINIFVAEFSECSKIIDGKLN